MPAATPSVLVIHGPNLNLLGEREPEVYGHTTLAQLDAQLSQLGSQLGVAVICEQANGEGAIIDLLHHARTRFGAVVINPGGYTHTSVAIHDAIAAITIPVLEVHLSNLYARESFRHESVTGPACAGVIMGLGTTSYALALRHAAVLAGATSSPS
ncbi:MAG: type II 3-dehydroquinate dehydratase [Myxococcales bacterium FL481]|nr:MAG: type II 3-dehydroquinate dehydratase [Myxococcales bacterium FL481]